MNRREFGGLFALILGGLFAGGGAVVAESKSVAAAASATATGLSGLSSNNNFFITMTTFFPRAMSIKEYKQLVNQCRNIEESEALLAAMRAEGKLISSPSLFSENQVMTCFEFSSEQAFREYEERYQKIPGNSTEKKKAMGFRTAREYKRTLVS